MEELHEDLFLRYEVWKIAMVELRKDLEDEDLFYADLCRPRSAQARLKAQPEQGSRRIKAQHEQGSRLNPSKRRTRLKQGSSRARLKAQARL